MKARRPAAKKKGPATSSKQRKKAPAVGTKAKAKPTRSPLAPAAPTAAGKNDIGQDQRLRQLLKPLLPKGTELLPLTLDGGDYPPLPDEVELPAALDVTRRKVKIYGIRKEQEVPFIKLQVLYATVPNDGAFDRVERVQDALRPHGYQALVTATETGFDFESVFHIGLAAADEKFGGKALVVFFRSPDPLALLFARGTNGVNYGKGIHTHHIAGRLRAWAAECNYVLLGAGFDWVRMRFRTTPRDVARFVGELYLLCPEGLDESGKPLPKKLWDMSFEDQQPYAAEIGKALGARTAADLGEYFGPKNELFLWWD